MSVSIFCVVQLSELIPNSVAAGIASQVVQHCSSISWLPCITILEHEKEHCKTCQLQHLRVVGDITHIKGLAVRRGPLASV